MTMDATLYHYRLSLIHYRFQQFRTACQQRNCKNYLPNGPQWYAARHGDYLYTVAGHSTFVSAGRSVTAPAKLWFLSDTFNLYKKNDYNQDLYYSLILYPCFNYQKRYQMKPKYFTFTIQYILHLTLNISSKQFILRLHPLRI